MEIKIVGANTLNGIILKKRIIKIAYNIDEKVTIHFIEKQNIEDEAFLYINNKLLQQEKLPAEKDIVKFIKKLYK